MSRGVSSFDAKKEKKTETTEAERSFDDSPWTSALTTLRRDGDRARRAGRLLWALAKQLFVALAIGLATGAVGTAFQYAMRGASRFFSANYASGVPWALWALPLAGLAIVGFYSLAGLSVDAGTNRILESSTGRRRISLWLAPAIFLGSATTQFFGGSAGREGAALQLGGCVGVGFARLFRLRRSGTRVAILCGMSGGFAAVFGTPLTAAVFALEIACVGVIYYPAFFASLISAFVGSAIASTFGFPPFHYELPSFPKTSISLVAQTIALGVLCGAVCYVFCASIRFCDASLKRRFPNDYWRAAFGGAAVVATTFFLGTDVYNGTGLANVEEALAGRAAGTAFFWKTALTALTIGAGFKGGEIVPAFAVGATFGCVASRFLGIDPQLGAAMGTVAVFCGAVNCPLTAIVLSVELFGAENALLFAILCGAGYATSGRVGLYRSQRILYPKAEREFDALRSADDSEPESRLF